MSILKRPSMLVLLLVVAIGWIAQGERRDDASVQQDEIQIQTEMSESLRSYIQAIQNVKKDILMAKPTIPDRTDQSSLATVVLDCSRWIISTENTLKAPPSSATLKKLAERLEELKALASVNAVRVEIVYNEVKMQSDRRAENSQLLAVSAHELRDIEKELARLAAE